MVRIKTFIDEPSVEVKKIDELVAKAIIDGTDFSFEGLLNRGLITIDQLANYINNVGDVDYLANIINGFSDSLAIQIFNNPNLSFSRATSILNSSVLSEYKSAKILNGLPTDKAVNILQNLSTDIVKKIMYKLVDLGYYEKLIDIITYDASDVTLTSNRTFSGVQRFRNLNLNGYTYTADGQPHVIIAYSINVPSASSIIKTATGGGGGYNGSVGGDGYVYVDIIDNYTSRGGNAGGGGDCTRGGGGGGPLGYGGSGSIQNGGGGGPITVVKTNLLITNLYTLSDWYIVNVLGRTPSSVISFTNSYNAGGGGGSETSGGSGGGCLIIFCNSLNCSGSIVASGAGGSGGHSGGGGGGGGIIYIYSSIITCNTINATGGSGGNGNTGYGGGGGGGAGGIVYVFYRNSYNITTINVSGGGGGLGKVNGSAGQSGFYRIIKF